MLKNLLTKKSISTLVSQFFVVIIFLSVCNIIFYSGNNPNKKEIDQYMKHWEILQIDKNMYPAHQRVRYIAGFRFGPFKCAMRKEIYHFKGQNKYIAMLTFENFMNDEDREIYRIPWEIEKIYVNTSQYNNQNYGTIENPVPAFPKLYRDTESGSVLPVSTKLNQIFAEQYLKFFMPEEEFKEMFKN